MFFQTDDSLRWVYTDYSSLTGKTAQFYLNSQPPDVTEVAPAERNHNATHLNAVI